MTTRDDMLPKLKELQRHPFGLVKTIHRVDNGPALTNGHIPDCPMAWPEDALMAFGWGPRPFPCPHVALAMYESGELFP